jgi:hypothetical protein
VRWLLLLLLAVGCTRGAGTRCERVCRAEADCADKLEVADHDLGACVDACAELERAAATQRLVEAHIRCVNSAPTCAAVLDCQ